MPKEQEYAHAGAIELEQGAGLGAFPTGPRPVRGTWPTTEQSAGAATAAGLAAFRVGGELVEAALVGFLVDPGAADLTAAGDEKYGGFPAAAQAAYH